MQVAECSMSPSRRNGIYLTICMGEDKPQQEPHLTTINVDYDTVLKVVI